MHLAVGFMGKGEMEKMLAMFNALNTDRETPLAAGEITELLGKGKAEKERATIAKTVQARPPPLSSVISLSRPPLFAAIRGGPL